MTVSSGDLGDRHLGAHVHGDARMPESVGSEAGERGAWQKDPLPRRAKQALEVLWVDGVPPCVHEHAVVGVRIRAEEPEVKTECHDELRKDRYFTRCAGSSSVFTDSSLHASPVRV